MRQLHTLAAVLAIVSVGVTGASAQGRGNSGAPKAAKAPTTLTHGNSGGGATHGSTSTHGPSSDRGSAKGGPQASSTTSPGDSRGGGSGKGSAKTTTSTASATTGNGSTTTTTTTTVAPPNALSMKVSKNPQQLARLTGMLPAGMTLEQATTGFRNQGQFIAALNASKNQGVSFADLQQAMTVDGLSLGQAVKQLRTAPPAPETPTTGTTPPTTGTTSPTTGTGATTTTATTTAASRR